VHRSTAELAKPPSNGYLRERLDCGQQNAIFPVGPISEIG
jgi:hypothetical protein